MTKGTGKGTTNNPKGRPKGSTNKATLEIKEAYKNLLELNTPNMVEWLERVASVDPEKALDICLKMSEYIIPKLARVDGSVNHSGEIALNNILQDIDGRSSGLPSERV